MGRYQVEPRRNKIGDWGFVTYDVRCLHNKLYHEEDVNAAKRVGTVFPDFMKFEKEIDPSQRGIDADYQIGAG